MQIKYFCEYVTVIIIMSLLCHSDDLVCNKWMKFAFLISPRGVMRNENLQHFRANFMVMWNVK